MAKKTLGYVHLEWRCPFCETTNLGANKKCGNCGSPQPDDAQFEQAAQEKFIKDKKIIAKAKTGPDIHCPYCGTRNPAGATACGNCMGDLTEATAREKGKVVGKHRKEAAPDIACPFCEAMNPATAYNCANCNGNLRQQPQPKQAVQPAPQRRKMGAIGIIGIIAVIAACIFVASLFLRTDDVSGRVSTVEWTRSIAIEALVPVERSAFIDEIPAELEVYGCRQELHHVQDDPAPNAQQVCGTPYTVDTGTGVGEVVQDCQYEVYEDYCSFTVDEWRQVDMVTERGSNLNPFWPQPQLTVDQRLGAEQEQFEIAFESDGQQYFYTTNSLDQFTRFEVGSEWILEVNQLSGVVSVEPAR
ncbi:MAG: zinc ribbon domain-containing protein [Chloroflexi bacterium]|nr:zinc ribbon domain-containing protein [Chloroflexota bacterium]